MISQEQLDLIRAYDKKDPYVMDSLLDRVWPPHLSLKCENLFLTIHIEIAWQDLHQALRGSPQEPEQGQHCSVHPHHD